MYRIRGSDGRGPARRRPAARVRPYDSDDDTYRVDALARERRCLIYPELGQTTATN